MLRKLLSMAIGLAATLPTFALTTDSLSVPARDRMIFNHLDASVTLGTTGIGLEVSTPLTKYLRVRAGVEFMPKFSMPVSFGLDAYSEDGTNESGGFERQQKWMKEFTGIEVDDKVDMDGKPNLTNFKLLFDIYPWTNTNWHITAGFYLGGRKIATATNSVHEMHSLFAVNLYNEFYDRVLNDEPLYGDVYLSPDFLDNGRVGMHVGDFKDGTPYIMTPGEDGMVRANAYVNSFRPYLGFGYGGNIGKSDRLFLSFDAGALFWGKPKIVMHDGTDLANEVTNIGGKVGDYVDVVKAFRVYPVVEVKLTYKFF